VPGPGGGLLFDLDSTLAQTTAIWNRAEERMLAAAGASWSAELAVQYKGMNARDLASVVHRVLKLKMPLPELQERMRSELLAAYAALPVQPVPGAPELVRRLCGLAPIAVASGSPLEGIRRAVEALDLCEVVEACVSSESVPRGKPHPDVFLVAAETLGATPARCVVFEDSVVGAQAARAAGMRCIVCPSFEAHEFARLASRLVRSWDEVSREDVAALLASAS
jgi:beta-phosphoglucomutase-like phosphatase (HAD superfamily)